MATGWNSIHPLMAEGLKKCGVAESDISQGFGWAAASASFHAPEGYIDGHKFSSCVDLRWHLAKDRGPELKSHLVEAGFCPFYRDWAGNQHIHNVYTGAKDQSGNVTIKAGPRSQIIDFTRGLNGLVGHDQLSGPFAPTSDERAQILAQYQEWAPHVATRIIGPDGKQILCYAFIEKESDLTRAELRPLMEGLGCVVSWKDGVLLVTRNGQKIDTSKAKIKLEGGQFTRGGVRALAEAAGFHVYPKDSDIVISN